MTKASRDYEARLEKRYRDLRTRSPRCVSCNEADPFTLELHHIAGREHHEDLSILCANCHRKLTNQQKDHVPPDQPKPIGELATIGHYLLGLCDLLKMVIETLEAFARDLIGMAQEQEATS